MEEGTRVRRRSGRRREIGIIRYTFVIDGRRRALVYFSQGHPEWGAYEQNIDLDELVEVRRIRWLVTCGRR